nr:MAG TPA: hypothetical protein [Crassvirales sp.]DAU06291.1 MAG TPA: hypothetical protein [Caudoviricetes sp.]DAX21724.1 MAG TPA: hypothetical protein [Caudoviricetes sp.]
MLCNIQSIIQSNVLKYVLILLYCYYEQSIKYYQ